MKTIAIRILCAICGLAVLTSSADAATISNVRVVEVITGDSVRVTTGRLNREGIVFESGTYYYSGDADAEYELVNLKYCKAPAIDDPGGETARQFLEQMVLHRSVEMRFDESRTAYGRKIAQFTLTDTGPRTGRIDVNRELLRTGWARYTDAEGSDPRMKDSADEAKRKGIGLYQAKYSQSAFRAGGGTAPGRASLDTGRSNLAVEPADDSRSTDAPPREPTPEEKAERAAKASQIRIEVVAPQTARGARQTPQSSPERLIVRPSNATTTSTDSVTTVTTEAPV